MKKLLVIDATGRSNTESRTKLLGESVVNKLSSEYETTYLDLYKMHLPYVNQEILESRISKTYQTVDQLEAERLVCEFENADAYIFIYPVWNWSVPAILKTYLDLVLISGRNFTYKGAKIVGLLENKKAYLVSTAGGPLLNSFLSAILKDYNANIYMKRMLAIMGIKDTTVVCIDKMAFAFKSDKCNFDLKKYQEKISTIVNKL